MFPYSDLSAAEINDFLTGVDAARVAVALERERLVFEDFLALLSPVAQMHLPTMRVRARCERRKHFGRTVRLYTPLYVSNICINACVYCGFRAGASGERVRLDLAGILREAEVIRGFGIASLLLVSGEDPEGMPLSLLCEAARLLRRDFPYLAVEIYPLDEAGYRELMAAGVHGLTLYQETYDRDLYSRLHPSGPKGDFDARIDAVTNGARAGMYSLGIGALLGLSDWRLEMANLALHGLWLRKHFWRSRLQFSFPRLTTVAGYSAPASVMDLELEQIMLAFRIYFPESDITVSTREGVDFRNRLVQDCASHMSAASKVIPGAYAESSPGVVGQFTLHDSRSAAEIERDLADLQLQAVWKDWDICLGTGGGNAR